MKFIITYILLLFVSINTNADVSVSIDTHARDRIALVIGNSDYQVSPLDNPINDARGVASTLKGLNFKVTLVEDANQQTMEEAIENFGEKLNKDTVGLFYYSGHAIQYNGSNYLIPVGALSKVKKSSHLKYKTVPAGLVLDELEQSQSKLNFVFLDACRDNPFKGFSKGISFGLVKPESAQGTLISYATAPGEVASDGIGNNSPYTKHLINQITKPNVQVELMLKEVNAAVFDETNEVQSPWYESSISGKFCFNEVNGRCGVLVIEVISDLKSLEEINRLLRKENNELREQLNRIDASTAFGGVKLSYTDVTGEDSGDTDTSVTLKTEVQGVAITYVDTSGDINKATYKSIKEEGVDPEAVSSFFSVIGNAVKDAILGEPGVVQEKVPSYLYSRPSINYYSDKTVSSLDIPPDLTTPSSQKAFKLSQYVGSYNKQDYVQQIALKVKDNWRYKGAKNNWGCDVYIMQDRQGNIKSTNVQSCVVDNKAKMKPFRDSIERAVNKASPLPQAPSAEIFAPEILFHFKVN